MKNNTMLLVLLFGSIWLATGSCSNGRERSSNDGLAMDSVSVAEREQEALTLSILKDKKLAAEKKVMEAVANTKEAKRLERDAADAAEQADQAFETEEAAQKSRRQADAQANKADKASLKSDEN